MKEIDEGGNLCVIAKYGVQLTPFVKSMNIVGDQFTTVSCASYGATTTDIYSTFDDEYIKNRVEEGKDKYISPDKQVDASTCMFPDQTWFIKGANHSDWTDAENRILYNVITADNQLTVDDSVYSQFFIAVKQEGANQYKFAPMDEGNCDNYYWKANKKADEATGKERLAYFVFAIATLVLKLLTKLIKDSMQETTPV